MTGAHVSQHRNVMVACKETLRVNGSLAGVPLIQP